MTSDIAQMVALVVGGTIVTFAIAAFFMGAGATLLLNWFLGI